MIVTSLISLIAIKVPPSVAQHATVLWVAQWGEEGSWQCFNRLVDRCHILASWECVGSVQPWVNSCLAGDDRKVGHFCYQLMVANTTQTQSVLLLQLTCYSPPSSSPRVLFVCSSKPCAAAVTTDTQTVRRCVDWHKLSLVIKIKMAAWDTVGDRHVDYGSLPYTVSCDMHSKNIRSHIFSHQRCTNTTATITCH